MVALGKVEGSAKQTIDASDCVVAQEHPHALRRTDLLGRRRDTFFLARRYECGDGQLYAGIAPCLPEAREIAMRDLVNVEAIPYDVLAEGITWDWETFPQYMAAAEQ